MSMKSGTSNPSLASNNDQHQHHDWPMGDLGIAQKQSAPSELTTSLVFYVMIPSGTVFMAFGGKRGAWMEQETETMLRHLCAVMAT